MIKVLSRSSLKTLYSAVYDSGYPFHSLCTSNKIVPVTSPVEMVSFDSALIIWGGSDISPEFYKHPMSTRCYPYAGRRDMVEWALLHEAINMEIPIIGVCRGAQMLCAAAGGFLLQDVNNHAGPSHMVTTFDGKEFKVNSIHHQMMVPYGVNHELVAWTSKPNGAPYIYRDDKIFDPDHLFDQPMIGDEYVDGWKEAEFVYFPEIRGYAVQWHPEGMDDSTEATQYVLNFIRTKEKERLKKLEVLPNAATNPA